MKKTVKLLALICALVMLVSLAACGEKKEDSAEKSDSNETEAVTEAPASNLTDFEWIKFEMPEGWKDANESDSYVTINEEANDHHIMKFFKRHLFDGDTMESIVEKEMEYSKNPSIEGTIEVGGRTWYRAYFDFNDTRSVQLFTKINDDYYGAITIYEMTEEDPAVQTVLKSLEYDPAKIS